MDGERLVLIILGVIGAVGAIPGIIQIIRSVLNFFYALLSFRNLSIGEIGRTSYRGIPHVTIKIALVGKEDIIVDEVFVQSKLSYARRIEGFFAWLQLGIGYVLDDVEGLNTVLGKSPPYTTWIPVIPFYRIHNSHIRRPLSTIWGIVIFYYFIIFCIFPPYWLFLFMGPYAELRLFSGDEKVSLSGKDSNVELKRPFILKSGIENILTIGYRPSLYYNSILMTKLFIQNAKISYVKKPRELRTTKLPQNNEFIWRVTDILRVKVKGKMRGYSVKFGTSYVNIHL